MSSAPFAWLPQEICFSLRETADILATADAAERHAARQSEDWVLALAVQRMVTARLWPELGRLLREPDGEEG